MTDVYEREVIPAGKVRPISWRHLVPIARFLIEERGHLPIHNPERWGFTSGQSGGLFQLSRRITEEDWEALNRHFVIPPNIQFHKGLIRDNDNRVDFLGFDEVVGLNGVEPIEVFERDERARPRTYGRPDLGERHFPGEVKRPWWRGGGIRTRG